MSRYLVRMRNPGAFLDVDEHGGMVAAVGNNEKQSVGMYIAELGGFVEVNGKDESKINLSFNEYGGNVAVIGHGGLIGILGKDMSPKAVMGGRRLWWSNQRHG